MTGPILPPGFPLGPVCFIKVHSCRPSLVTQADHNPYARAVVATAAAVALTMATGAPTIARALAVILCAICKFLFLLEALR